MQDKEWLQILNYAFQQNIYDLVFKNILVNVINKLRLLFNNCYQIAHDDISYFSRRNQSNFLWFTPSIMDIADK